MRARPATVLGMLIVIFACGPTARGRLEEARARIDREAALVAYTEARAQDGEDLELLGLVAETTLLELGRDTDASVRREALHQLTLAGTRGRRGLTQLASFEATHIDALLALSRSGDTESTRVLRALADDPSPETRAAATHALHAERDATLLLARCAGDVESVQYVACGRIDGEKAPAEGRAVLERVARDHPREAVRAAAVRSLGTYGDSAIGALRDRLSDASDRVRAAALDALFRASPADGRQAALALIALPTGDASIEAARLLITPRRHEPASAEDRSLGHAALVRGLAHSDGSLRARSAQALLAAANGHPPSPDVLAPFLEREPLPAVRGALAELILLAQADHPQALVALEQLALEDHGPTGIRAAVVLLGQRRELALGRLRDATLHTDPLVRRAAARSLARDADQPFDVELLLRDSTATVRAHAAGGILACLAHRDG